MRAHVISDVKPAVSYLFARSKHVTEDAVENLVDVNDAAYMVVVRSVQLKDILTWWLCVLSS